MENIKFLSLDGNEDLVDKYFHNLFREKYMRVIESHCNLEGYPVDEYISCEFAAEYTEEEFDYFGEDLVGISCDPPYANEECMVILTYEEFYAIAEREYIAYAEKHEYLKKGIMRLLAQLKKVLLQA